MGTANPPDKMTVVHGTWGTDIDVDTTKAFAGDASTIFLGTTPAVDTEYATALTPAAPGDIWLADFVAQVSSVAAGNEVYAAIEWWDSGQSYLSVAFIYNSAVLPSINTWHKLSGSATAPANTGFTRALFGKSNTAFTANLGLMGARPVQPGCRVSLGSAQSISSSTPATVNLDTEEYDYGGNFDTGTHAFTAPLSGTYSITGEIRWGNSIADQKLSGGYSLKNGSTILTSIWRASSGAEYFSGSFSGVVLLARGDTVVMKANHTDTGDKALLTSGETWMAIHKI
jgi:hypothetical protein